MFLLLFQIGIFLLVFFCRCGRSYPNLYSSSQTWKMGFFFQFLFVGEFFKLSMFLRNGG